MLKRDSRAGIARGVLEEGGGGGGRAGGMRLEAAARTVRDGFSGDSTHRTSPEHWRRIRTNGIERINREIRRRTRVGTFPDGNSPALMLVTARLKYIVEHEWGKRSTLDMSEAEVRWTS